MSGFHSARAGFDQKLWLTVMLFAAFVCSRVQSLGATESGTTYGHIDVGPAWGTSFWKSAHSGNDVDSNSAIVPAADSQLIHGSAAGLGDSYVNQPMISHEHLMHDTERLPWTNANDRWFPFGYRVPILDRWIQPPHFRHGGDDRIGRHIGMGDPLVGTSWRNRPLYVGWLFGGMIGDELIRGNISQDSDMVGGYRVGWDFDHYWGTEARFTFAHIDVTSVGAPAADRTNRMKNWDVNLLYYPWGDSRWRPFLEAGVGWQNNRFIDNTGREIQRALFTMPVGGGFKYYWKNWMALRLTAIDNWAIGSGRLSTMHSASITFDVEMRFGGSRRSYFPHSDGGYIW